MGMIVGEHATDKKKNTQNIRKSAQNIANVKFPLWFTHTENGSEWVCVCCARI